MSPAQQLADALLDRRAAGLPFDFAWSASLDEVEWPADLAERAQWRAALHWAMREFRDAYERPQGLPAHVQRVLSRPADGMRPEALLRLAEGSDRPLRVLGAPMH